MDAFTPAQTTELISRIGAKKARMRIDKMFINSFMGGALISFGCALALSTNSSPWFQTNAPGLIRTISAMVFPVGLISKSSSDFSLLSKLVVDRKSGTNLHCPTPSWNTEAMSAAFSVHRELRMFREIVC
jgi:hypothetical protein